MLALAAACQGPAPICRHDVLLTEPSAASHTATDWSTSDTMFHGESVDHWITSLRDGSEPQRHRAAVALGLIWLGCKGFGVSGWTRAWTREERAAMLQAAKRGDVSPRSRALVPALIRALSDSSARVRTGAAGSLVLIGPDACTAGDALRMMLDSDDEEERAWAGRALYSVAMDTAGAIDAAVAGMKSRNPAVRRMSAYSLELMGSDASAAVPFLSDLVDDPDLSVRVQAWQALSAIRIVEPSDSERTSTTDR